MMDIRKIRCTVPCQVEDAASGCECAEARDEITRLRANLDRITLKTERWRGALVNIAQGKGDPVAVASRALEADNE